jgi:alkanesulfonate monooxygenase SsuD/methylene tetrahydromethanopterin reductase-like flavin-dependent oxidoreductase (luciferase family)
VATVVVAPESTRADKEEAVNARAAGYLAAAGIGEALVRANGWDADALAAFRREPRLAALRGQSADKMLSRRDLTDLSLGLPREWLPSASAAGSVDDCAKRLAEYLDAGADELILHGTTAHGLTELTRTLRP